MRFKEMTMAGALPHYSTLAWFPQDTDIIQPLTKTPEFFTRATTYAPANVLVAEGGGKIAGSMLTRQLDLKGK